MSSASILPRVRVMAVCDQVEASETEDHVFNLTGVRYYVQADTFPYRAALQLYLLLSCARAGMYNGYVLVVDEGTEKIVGRVGIQPTFEEDLELLPIRVSIACQFRHAGQYTFQVWFFQPDLEKADVVKAEQPFYVLD